MTPLVREDWVESVPGPGGGYQLRVRLESVSVLDLVEALEGISDGDRCVLAGTPCPPVEPCAIHAAWSRAREALHRELAATSLEQVLMERRHEGR